MNKSILNNLGELLERNASRYPDREALINGNSRITWKEIYDRSNQLAHGLAGLGIKKGDRVAILLSNCHQWPEILFALLSTGFVVVPINTRLSSEEIARIVNDSDAKAIIIGNNFISLIPSLQEICPSLEHMIVLDGKHDRCHIYEELLENQSTVKADVSVGPEDLAYIAYTSGTTGFPKGAMWHHGAMLETAKNIPFSYGLTFKATALMSGPLGISTQSLQLMNLVYGASKIVLTDFKIETIMKLIEKEKVNILGTASIPLYMMAIHPDTKKYDLGSLRLIRYGGSPLTEKQLMIIQSTFKCELHQGYGGTETFVNISILDHYDHNLDGDSERIKRLMSVGRIFDGYEVKLLDDNSNEVPVGEVGEVTLKTRHMMSGYWKKPKETENILSDGWYRTRDMGYFDEEGYLFLVDRKDDMIKSGGLSVYPAEVEKILLNHQGVEEGAVIGVPDDKWGKKVVAIVVPKNGVSLTEEELRQYCRGKIADFKIPKQILFQSEPLPRGSFGKVVKKNLHKSFASEIIT